MLSYGHAEWFLGQSDDIPTHPGYTLSFELVSKCIQKHGKKASQLYAEPAEYFQRIL